MRPTRDHATNNRQTYMITTETSPGPHDSHYLFKDFVKMMEEWKG